jgi:AAA15 family ATPase/GTPase
MIQGISIENFRVFHKTEINGFGLVNLFGGKNNAGKTCLLEALYAALKGNLDVSINLRQQKLPLSDAQKNLFFNLDTSRPVSFEVKNEDNETFTTKEEYDTASFSIKTTYDIRGLTGEQKTIESIFWQKNKLNFILSKDEQYPDNLNLSAEFDRADIDGESILILKAVQIIDPSVLEIKTYATFPETLYLRKKNEKIALPITNYGDALQKMMRYILTIVKLDNEQTKGGKFLLIDEIENGLHHTVQQEFWTMLFELAVEYNIQIFAATHSSEMIEAFGEVAQKPEFVGKGVFFELFRHLKTNEIIANKFNANTLEYNIQHKLSLRGE